MWHALNLALTEESTMRYFWAMLGFWGGVLPMWCLKDLNEAKFIGAAVLITLLFCFQLSFK